jgi:hypothetical protein
LLIRGINLYVIGSGAMLRICLGSIPVYFDRDTMHPPITISAPPNSIMGVGF